MDILAGKGFTCLQHCPGTVRAFKRLDDAAVLATMTKLGPGLIAPMASAAVTPISAEISCIYILLNHVITFHTPHLPVPGDFPRVQCTQC